MNAQIEEKKEFVTSCATIKDAYKSYCTLRDTPRTGSTGDKYTLNVRESQAEQKMAAGIIDINYSLREKIPNVDYDRRQDYPRIIENINTKIQTK